MREPIIIEATPGEVVDETVKRAWMVAHYSHQDVEMRHNDRRIRVRPSDTEREILKAWHYAALPPKDPPAFERKWLRRYPNGKLVDDWGNGRIEGIPELCERTITYGSWQKVTIPNGQKCLTGHMTPATSATAVEPSVTPTTPSGPVRAVMKDEY